MSSELTTSVDKEVEQIIEQTGGKKKKVVKKATRKQKGGDGDKPKRELNPTMKALVEFRKFLADDSGLKQGVPMVKLSSFLVNKAKAKDSSLTSLTAIAVAKKIYLDDKSGAKKAYESFVTSRAEPARAKATKKKTPKKK